MAKHNLTQREIRMLQAVANAERYLATVRGAILQEAGYIPEGEEPVPAVVAAEEFGPVTEMRAAARASRGRTTINRMKGGG